MAIVGAINITMDANATKFNAGLASARMSLAGFAKAATSALGTKLSATNVGSAFSDIGAGIKIAASMVSANAGIIASNIKGMGLGSALKGADFKMLGGPIGLVASGLGRVAVSAAQASGSLARMVESGVGMAVTGFRGMLGVVSDVGVKLGLVGAAGAYGIYKLVKAGSDLIESQNLTKEVFKGSAGVVINASEQMAAAFGVSKTEFLTAAGRMGGIFKGAGFAQDEAAALSVQFTKLSGDIASFFNLPIEEAADKLRSGLVGQIRPLRDLGVNIDDDMVKANAYATGIANLGDELTANQKVQSRITLITKGLADAHGDLARTSADVANKMREVWGRISNVASTIGVALQPIAKKVLGEMSNAVGALSLLWKDNQAAVMAWIEGLAGGGKQGGESMGLLQKSIGYVADTFQQMSIGFTEMQISVTSGIMDMIHAFTRLGGTVGKIITALSPAAGALIGSFGGESVADLAKLKAEQEKTLAGKKAAKPFSESINKFFAEAKANAEAAKDAMTFGAGGMKSVGAGLIGGGLGRLLGITDTSRAAGVAGGGLAGLGNMLSTSLGKATEISAEKTFSQQEKLAVANLLGGGLGSIAGGIKPRKETGEFRFASAAVAGSAEAANAVLRSKFGQGAATPDAAIKSTAKNTATANGHLAKIAAGVDKLILFGNLQPYEFVSDLG